MVVRHHDFVRRFNLSDAEGIATTFYASDAVIYQSGQQPLVGRAAIIEFLRDVHAKKNRRCALVLNHVESSGDLAMVTGSYRVDDLNESGEFTSDHGWLLENWRRDRDGCWWCIADMYVSVTNSETKNTQVNNERER